MDPASAPARIALFLDEIGVEADRRGERAWSLRVPCSTRGPVGVQMLVRERSVGLRAFVMRAPDRNHVAVWERLLGKNLVTADWRFAIDADRDVYAIAGALLVALDADVLDGLLGALSALVDETYEGIVRAGFDVPPGTEFLPPPVDEGLGA